MEKTGKSMLKDLTVIEKFSVLHQYFFNENVPLLFCLLNFITIGWVNSENLVWMVEWHIVYVLQGYWHMLRFFGLEKEIEWKELKGILINISSMSLVGINRMYKEGMLI